jgi:hypothetical protein
MPNKLRGGLDGFRQKFGHTGAQVLGLMAGCAAGADR